jgi:hypothetical protein
MCVEEEEVSYIKCLLTAQIDWLVARPESLLTDAFDRDMFSYRSFIVLSLLQSSLFVFAMIVTDVLISERQY